MFLGARAEAYNLGSLRYYSSNPASHSASSLTHQKHTTSLPARIIIKLRVASARIAKLYAYISNQYKIVDDLEVAMLQ
jgi:hypothetical protein